VAADNTEVIDFLDDEPIVGGSEETSYEELYSFLLSNEDIIIVIDKDADEPLRRGMSLVKYQYSQKMAAAHAPIDNRQIGYKVIEEVEGTDPVQIKLQIWLRARKSVKVHQLIVSDKGF
jgi:hypothetical protein